MGNGKDQISVKRKIVFFSIYILFLPLVILIIGEIVVRIGGYQPWKPIDTHVAVEPGGALFKKNSSLGYTHLPGKFRVTLDSGYTFNATHLPNTLRITHPVDSLITSTATTKESIWIFGCSFAYGWSVNDSETFPWLLQKKFPEYEVVNFGVSGYGTVHSLLQLRERLKTERPKIVVLTVADFHEERNTFTRRRRKAIVPWNRLGPLIQPRARLDMAGQLHCDIADVDYKPLPLMKQSALINFIDDEYSAIIEPRLYNNRRVAEKLVWEMADLAGKNGAVFVLANICRARYMQIFADKNGISNVDISVNLELPENNNLPYDTHPSALAHKKYADRLEVYLRKK